MSIIWEPCAAGARVLRVLGDSPALPCRKPWRVCLSPRSAVLLWPTSRSRPGRGAAGPTPMRSRPILWRSQPCPTRCAPCTARRFTTAARLRRLSLGAGVEGLGSDLFTNCRSLARLCLRAAPDAPTGLKKLLGAISADITAEFDGARLFYPNIPNFLTRTRPRTSSTITLRARATGCGNALRRPVRWTTPRSMHPLRRPVSARARVRSAGWALGRLVLPFALAGRPAPTMNFTCVPTRRPRSALPSTPGRGRPGGCWSA